METHMPIYFAPTDEEVETLLGRKLGSWPASPHPSLVSTYERAAKTENAVLSTIVQMGLFILAAVLAVSVGAFFHNVILGGITLLVAGFGALLAIGKIKAVAHSRAPLGVFENGIRLGASIVRFDGLSAITFGAPESFGEKYFPTLGKYSEFVGEVKVGAELMQQAKDIREIKQKTTLTFHFQNGRVSTWPAFGLLFTFEHAEEFIKLLNQVAPELLPTQTDKEPAPDHDGDVVDLVTLESIEGLWRMISVGRNGNFAPPEVIEKGNVTVAIVGNTITPTDTLELSTIELNNNVIPNQLDQTDQNGDKHLCIIRMRGGNLEICQGEVGKPRPTSFNRQRNDGASLTMFEMVMNAEELEEENAE